MSVIGSNILAGASGQGGDYTIARSLRFRKSAGAYLTRTFSSTGNQQKFTFSDWVKRGQLGVVTYLAGNIVYSGGGTTNEQFNIYFGTDDKLEISSYANTGFAFRLITTQVFRDPSAWYHIVVAFDTTQATDTNRVKVYVNGSQITSFSTTSYPSQNYNTYWNRNIRSGFGAIAGVVNGSDWVDTASYFDGYIAEAFFIDGQQLTPSSFGANSEKTGVWQPKKYVGTYGTNGFYLPFSDNSALTTSSNAGLGKDFSGNGNYWTTNNISLTAGSTYDSMTDVPTLTDASTANFAVLNAISQQPANTWATSNGNLNLSQSYQGSPSTIAMSSGKWYWEVTGLTNTSSNNLRVGIAPQGYTVGTSTVGDLAGSYAYSSNGYRGSGGTYVLYGTTYTDNDVIGVAFDADAGTLTFYKNGTSQGQAYSGISGTFFALTGSGSSSTMTLVYNFGQRPFAYTPPTGFVALNTFNLPTPTIGATASTQANKYFDVVAYTGANTNAGNSITSLNFSPDFVWAKIRSQAYSHLLYDRLRGTGATAELSSDSSGAEGSTSSSERGYLNSFDTNGFSSVVGSNGDNLYFNQTSQTYVAWNWKANGTGVSNTAGSITSTVSANTSAGFSVVTYTGTGANATIGHGLGVAPKFILTKSRTDTSDWYGYHASLGNTKNIFLSSTAAASTSNLWWNATTPTSTVFSVGDQTGNNGSGVSIVAYCFSEVAGYSKFGSYTGNGSSDGTFVYTGFRPKFVMFKRTDASGDWNIRDTSRSPTNVVGGALYPNLSLAEYSGTETYVDLLSNGIKFRGDWNASNASGGSYIYAAFAEVPTKFALAR